MGGFYLFIYLLPLYLGRQKIYCILSVLTCRGVTVEKTGFLLLFYLVKTYIIRKEGENPFLFPHLKPVSLPPEEPIDRLKTEGCVYKQCS